MLNMCQGKEFYCKTCQIYLWQSQRSDCEPCKEWKTCGAITYIKYYKHFCDFCYSKNFKKVKEAKMDWKTFDAKKEHARLVGRLVVLSKLLFGVPNLNEKQDAYMIQSRLDRAKALLKNLPLEPIQNEGDFLLCKGKIEEIDRDCDWLNIKMPNLGYTIDCSRIEFHY